MRSLPVLAFALLTLLPDAAAAQRAASADLVVTARFNSRTSLKVSTHVLRFEVSDPSRPASISVEFAAAARAASGAEVMLSVERIRALEGPGGAADVESAISFAGDGDGTLAGLLDSNQPTIAARWTGSGLHHGRLVFSLRAPAGGSYTVPIRFVLSAP